MQIEFPRLAKCGFTAAASAFQSGVSALGRSVAPRFLRGRRASARFLASLANSRAASSIISASASKFAILAG
jgi:hypothetical protein